MNRTITIAGGGLAGLSLAIALRLRGVPVTVLEATCYPRHRVCGEFISGVSMETLEFLGISDLFHDAKRHHSLSWSQGGHMLHRDRLIDPAFGISRYQLDHRLQQRLLERGGRLVTHHRARPNPEEGHVWAAGRKAKAGNWIGLKAHVRGLSLSADLEMHSGTNGYVGLAAVEDDWVNVCGLFQLDRSLSAKGAAMLTTYLNAGGNTQLARRLLEHEWREGSFSAVAGFEFGRQPIEGGILAIGDAESMIPPFTGNGMSMALQAAESACMPLAEWSAGGISWNRAANEARAALDRRFSKRLSAAMLFHHVILNEAGKTILRTLSTSQLIPFRPMLSLFR